MLLVAGVLAAIWGIGRIIGAPRRALGNDIPNARRVLRESGPAEVVLGG